jgi:hypothetical protein
MQLVNRYALVGEAQWTMGALNAKVDYCDRAPGIDQSIVDRDFAGDRAVLIATTVEGSAACTSSSSRATWSPRSGRRA